MKTVVGLVAFLASGASYALEVGTLPGELVVDQGLASYQIPIELPKGKGGNTPDLTINYSSQGSVNSVIGPGFSLSGLSSISRCGSSIAVDGISRAADNTEQDNFCLDGSRLITSTGTKGKDGSIYRLLADNYSKVELHGDALDSSSSFTVKTKAGERYTYSYHEPVNSWKLTQDTNTTGQNPITYSYNELGNIQSISYDIYDVEFVYEPYTGKSASYYPVHYKKDGVLVSSNKLLNKIVIKTAGKTSNYLALKRAPLSETGSSLSGQYISEISYCDANNACLPATKFEWQKSPEFKKDQLFLNKKIASKRIGDWGKVNLPSHWKDVARNWWVDADGNGELDYCKVASASSISCHFNLPQQQSVEKTFPITYWGDSKAHWWTDINSDQKTDFCRKNGNELLCSTFGADGTVSDLILPMSRWGNEEFRWWLDINGDSQVDFCRRDIDDLRCSINSGGKSWQDEIVVTDLLWEKSKSTQWVDLDGNGYKDLCRVGSGVARCTSFNSGSVIGDKQQLYPIDDLGEEKKRWWIDVNGDGASDFCRATGNKSGNGSNLTCSLGSVGKVNQLSNDIILEGGKGWPGTWGDDGKRWWLDLNRDGKVDFCRGTGSLMQCTNLFGESYEFKVTGWGAPRHWWLDFNQDSNIDFCRSSGSDLICETNTESRDPVLLLSKVTNGLGQSSSVEFGTYGDHSVPNKGAATEFPVRNYSNSMPVVSRLNTDNGNGQTSFLFQYGPGKYDLHNKGISGFEWVKQREFVNGTNYRNREFHYYTQRPLNQKIKKSVEYLPNQQVLSSDCSECTDESFWEFRRLTPISEVHSTFDVRDVEHESHEIKKSYKDISQRLELSISELEEIRYQDKVYFKKPDLFVPIGTIALTPVIIPSEEYYLVGDIKPLTEFNVNGEPKVATLTPVASDLVTILQDNAQRTNTVHSVIDSHLYASIVDQTPVKVVQKSASAFESQRTERSYDLAGKLVSTVVTDQSQVDVFGNVGFVSVTTTGNNPVTGVSEAFVQQTEYTYENNESAWLLGLNTHSVETFIGPKGDRVAKTFSFEYDPATGLLVKEISQPGHPLQITKQFIRNSDGIVTTTKQTALHGNALRTRVDSETPSYNGSIATYTVSNPLGQVSSTVVDRLNRVTTTKDINGAEQRIYLDGFGRAIEKWQKNATGYVKTTVEYLPVTSAQCHSHVPDGAKYCAVTSTPGLNEEIIFYDMLRRELRQVTQGVNGKWIYKDTSYNAYNQISGISRPYFKGGIPQISTTQYDVLGRMSSTSEPGPAGKKDSWINYTYGPSSITTVDAEGRDKTSYFNAMGWEINLSQPEGSFVNKTYYPDGKLHTTAGSDGHTITTVYDVHGNKVSLDDPDLGLWTYKYDAFGQLVSQTDAKNQTMTMSYDDLGRMVSRVEEQITVVDGKKESEYQTTSWTYDQLNDVNSIRTSLGSLLRVDQQGKMIKQYYYDSVGLLTKEELITPEQTLVRSFEHNGLGQVVKESRPNQFELNFQRDTETGIVTKIWGDISQLQLNFSPEEYKKVIQPLIDEALLKANDYLAKAKELTTQAHVYKARQEEYYALRDEVISIDGTFENQKFAELASAELSGRPLEVFENEFGEQFFQVPSRTVIIPGLVDIPVIQEANYHLKLEGNLLRKVSFEEWDEIKPLLTAKGEVAYYGEFRDGSLGLAKVELERDHPLYDQLVRSYFDRLKLLSEDIQRLEYVADQTHRDAISYVEAAEQLVGLVKQVKLISAKYESLGQQSQTEYAALSELDSNNHAKGKIVYWTLNDLDAEGRVTSELYGNGLVNSFDYNEGTGQLQNIMTFKGREAVRRLHYSYDRTDNVTLRHDLINDISETYTYDTLDRLRSNTLVGLNNKHTQNPLFNKTYSVIYDDAGNIKYKSDVGHYIYADPNHAHAVTRAGDKEYSYDANGNMVSGDGKQISWNSLNKPIEIKSSTGTVRFAYDETGQRYFKSNQNGDKTWYLGQSYERIERGNGEIEHKQYINAGGKLVAINIDRKKSNPDGLTASFDKQVRYLHSDALHSIDLITDQWGNVVDRKNYDAWGKARPFEWTKDASFIEQSLMVNRGYTSHEHIEETDLIHMNGRVYDSTIGRFLSADAFIQAPDNSQSYNRYSYVINNPMKYNDPSGHFFKKIGKELRRFRDKVVDLVEDNWEVIAAVVVTVVTVGAAAPWVASWGAASLAAGSIGNAVVAGAIGGAVGGAVGGALITKSFSGALKGALTGAISGAAGAFGGYYATNSLSIGAQKVAVSALGGCAAGAVSGGSCKEGAKLAVQAQVLSIGIELVTNAVPTYKRPDNRNGVYKPNGTAVVDPNSNNIGIATNTTDFRRVGLNVSNPGSLSEGSLFSRFFAEIPGFNSGAVLHDVFAGGFERAFPVLTQIPGSSLLYNQSSIFHVIGLNYVGLGARSFGYYGDNLRK
ncbi:type IV secretion protein Rhs [Vibrio sp. Of7-15]|uniref:RHS repeat-associated core domain-containing protein n=1 Tax=Vibrio sp. Of7-15 TaxID=2724879 RepID=UPI001EF19440|nr:RHS repeat-associated core domain-containing protein [Vibrio sp. Of7-15]MCG7496538.1 type IV secretion protein Rhs [Vibrio sp. Of7-15]